MGHNKKSYWQTKTFKNDILKRMVIEIANGSNKYFTEIGPKLASSIPTSSKDFKRFMNVSKTVLQEYTLQVKN